MPAHSKTKEKQMSPTHTEAAVCPQFQGRHSESSPGLWLDLVVSDPFSGESCFLRLEVGEVGRWFPRPGSVLTSASQRDG